MWFAGMNARRTNGQAGARSRPARDRVREGRADRVADGPEREPAQPEALEQTVDFIWLIARTMVERQPPPPRKLQ
jgi:hypothetical protein